MHDVDVVEVEVWNGFLATWTGGFSIAEIVDRGYRLRRRSDGAVLPETIAAERVRPAG
jgi:hypothetical protein